jgi:uncharacterized protein
MTMDSILPSLIGGALIGLAASIHLLLNGRVTGISGIINHLLDKPTSENNWRWAFLVGMILTGVAFSIQMPELFPTAQITSTPVIVIAGLLVGLGTVMGSGCTSGHGVCGISRFSIRSLIATIVFMAFGFLTVFLTGGVSQ